ncbi:universal stress protein [Polaribacter staleyi]|uniref:universal stress protein n=1 Tax=Polaribacter staleyi TaxID=2022337 RepID=UPI0031BA0D5A
MEKKKKYKILVLSDLKENTLSVLKSSVSLAKIIDADIHFFYAKSPTDIVKNDNQLSAKREINESSFIIDKEIKNIVNSFTKDNNVPIKYSFTIGNVKNEIDTYLKENNTDIVVLGKRKSKSLHFLGDNITDFVLQQHKGTIVIADEHNSLEQPKEMSLGIFNQTKSNNILVEHILSSSNKQLTSFKIVDSSSHLKEEPLSNDKKTTEYVFEKGDNAMKNICNYLSKSSINLLFVNRNHSNTTKSNIKEAIKNLNCSLILTT